MGNITFQIEIVPCQNVVSGVIKSEVRKTGDNVTKETPVVIQGGVIQSCK